jgi:hypothetical protein
MKTALVVACIASGVCTPLMAQQASQDEGQQATKMAASDRLVMDLLSRYQYRLEERDGRLAGPGHDFLRREAERAQFVAFAEEHYCKQIPRVVSMTLAALRDAHGFGYLAIESDPVSAAAACAPELRGNLDRIAAYARQYPYAFTFASDQEIEMIAEAGRLSSSASDPVWGLDQGYGLAHAIDRLGVLVDGEAARRTLKELRDHAWAHESARTEKSRHYMSVEEKPPAFERLRETLQPANGSEAEWIVDQLLLSDRVYRPYRDRRAGRALQAGAFYLSGLEREENMKAMFLRGYRAAQRAGDAIPRAVLKLGHWHLAYGRYHQSELLTLGNFARELATTNSLKMLNIAMCCRNPGTGWGDIGKWEGFGTLANVADPAAWTIVDLRPVRLHAMDGKLPSLSPQLRRWCVQYDAVLVLGGAEPATRRIWDS